MSWVKSSSWVLMDHLHVIGITHKDNLNGTYLKRYKKPTSWKNFMHNKSRRKYFDTQFLAQVKNFFASLNYWMTELGEAVYFAENEPLMVAIPESGFYVLVAPTLKERRWSE